MTQLIEAVPVAKKKLEVAAAPVGPLLVKNLYRLGWADIVVRSQDISTAVEKKLGKSLSRQRVSAIMNAVRVEQETIELIAKALGVRADELLKNEAVEIRE